MLVSQNALCYESQIYIYIYIYIQNYLHIISKKASKFIQ